MANESAKAAAAYALYRDLGPSRSLAKAFESGKTATNLRQLEYWCSQFSWVQRAKAWDEEQREAERIRREQDAIAEEARQRQEVADMNRRHAQLGVTLQAKMLKQMEALITAKSFGSQATVLAIKFATELERLARGEATERTEQQHSGEVGVTLTVPVVEHLAAQTPDELAEWRKKRGLPTPTSEEHLG